MYALIICRIIGLVLVLTIVEFDTSQECTLNLHGLIVGHIAILAVFLASPRAHYINGAAIPVDGAMMRIG